MTRSAIVASDLVVIPVQPSPFDLWASQEIVALVKEAQVFRPQLRAAFVANRVIVGTIIARALRVPLERSSLGQLRAEVSQRVVFAECSSSGRLVSELEANGRAAQEIRMLAEEIRGIAA